MAAHRSRPHQGGDPPDAAACGGGAGARADGVSAAHRENPAYGKELTTGGRRLDQSLLLRLHAFDGLGGAAAQLRDVAVHCDDAGVGDVLLELFEIDALAAEVLLDVGVAAAQVLLEPLGRALVEARRLEDEVGGGGED